MLGSSSFNSKGEDQDHANPPPPQQPPPSQLPLPRPRFSELISSSPPTISASSSSLIHNNPRQLLISCGELISRCDFSSANRLLSLLSGDFASSSGDSTERLVYYFSKALFLRLRRQFSLSSSTFTGYNYNPSCSASIAPLFLANPNPRPPQELPVRVTSRVTPSRSSSYLTLNQITPFIRFTHLTANQAILEAVEGYRAVRIIDMDIMHGVQWPPLLQAIVERSATLSQPPPVVRLTGGGPDPVLLERTGDRLWNFAQSLGLEFHFQGLMIPAESTGFVEPAEAAVNALALQEAVGCQEGEALAVHCGDYLHRLLKEYDTRPLRRFLHKVKTMNPRVLTLGEREADHNHPLFLRRFTEAVNHYGAVFDSLEATLPPHSQERVAVEEGWFGEEIKDVVGEESERRIERHQKFESWEALLRSSGFKSVPLSPFSLSQAKLLLRLHYPSEGYQLQL
ncbi:hypothetical protein Cgig2_008635 [Carnegiea gigantea]|uniref:Scarecrow-like protein 18 n=1 Tax=Carnegiea gigantea TaxID=171969 RepID=A0A9Q1JWH2_9CARY|nr:hypothetical protein Cgig2_008635 [Carnegiea gigantea]